MTVLAPHDVATVAQSIARMGESVFADLERLRAVTVAALTEDPSRRGLGPLEPLCADLLTRPGQLPVGCGFVAARDALRDAPYWLEWWTVPGNGQASVPSRLQVVVDPDADDFRDYTSLPWFAVPMSTGTPHTTGPYVDYLCTDEYALTFSVPVTAGGAFRGIVGADVFVRHVEQRTLSQIEALPGTVTLVNSQGRVLVSNDGVTDTGSLVRDVPVAAMWAAPDGDVVDQGGAVLYRCGDLPLALLVTR